MSNFGSWAGFAANYDLHQLVHMIYTSRNADTVEPNNEILNMISSLPDGSTILDFGSGVCINTLYYAMQLPNLSFCGYDSPQMISRVDEFAQHKYNTTLKNIPNLYVSSDWSSLSKQKFDCIYATLVLQHVPPKDIHTYLNDIKNMTSMLLIHGRRANDHSNIGTWKIIEEAGLYPSNGKEINYSTYGDPEEHLPICIYRL